MEMEQTLSIIKPDAVERKLIGSIISLIEGNELKIIEARMLRLSRQEAEKFYNIHRTKPFFESLVNYISEEIAEVQGKSSVDNLPEDKVDEDINVVEENRKVELKE